MTLSPIIKAKLEQYVNEFYLSDYSSDKAFERFVNDNILSQFQPDVFKTEYELLDQICVGGSNDLALDGIAISLNGQFIKSCEDIDEILRGNKKGSFEFFFIQSKNKTKFDFGEYIKFIVGVEAFLKEKTSMPKNEEIEAWHKIYNYIMSESIIVNWRENPSLNLYYVVNGTWENSQHITAYSEEFRRKIEEQRTFGNIDIFLIDSKKLIDIINVNENNYEHVMNLVDSMPLPEVSDVDNSSVVLCTANELIKLLTTDDKILRKNIFEDNVRDYQGDTTINQEIGSTIKNSPERFILLNNGITIVCDEIKEMNRKISLRNPQVVNGCQTCNVLFQNFKDNTDISNIYVVVKIIGSANNDIVNSIVKGTNRQNIVYEEAFEITSEFHKLLETFFNTFTIEGNDKIYYERRSKQYDNNSRIKPLQRVNFRILIQSFVTIFLYKAESGHIHESRLLHDYKNKIFKINQSFYPYYYSSFIYLFIEKLFRTGFLPHIFYTYKMQIMMIYKELIGGKSPDINNKKEIEKYCNLMGEFFKDIKKCKTSAYQAVELFKEISERWIEEYGATYRDNRKDNTEFTHYILNYIWNKPLDIKSIKNNGKVLKINLDRHGKLYGFIQCSPNNILFHENENPSININYEGKRVIYDVKKSGTRDIAIHVTLLD